MEISTKHATAQMPGSVVEPDWGRSSTSQATLQGSETHPDTRINRGQERRDEDPYRLRDGAPLVFAVYRVAVACYPKLLNRTLSEEEVLHRLRKQAPNSAFEIDYVARQAFKLINPYGHGANSQRFNNETLGSFRQANPEDAHLTAGLILLVCAAKWWIRTQGRRSVTLRLKPLATSDLDRKLKSFGFLAGERKAICRILRRVRTR